MSVETTLVSLTDAELIRLDGACQEKVQTHVDAAKQRASLAAELPDTDDAIVRLVAAVCEEARNKGKLLYVRSQIRHCRMCGKSAGYARYPRNGRYHSKGDINHDKPLTMSGIEFAQRFVVMSGHVAVGGCFECAQAALPLLQEKLADLKAEVPETITGHPPKWRRHDLKKCRECGWEGHEGQLGMLRAMMGGHYPGKCPSCGVESLPFGPVRFDTPSGFALTENTPTPETEGEGV